MAETLIGHCPVDSGQIMLIDPCYVLADNNTDDKKLNQLYLDICDVTIEQGAGEIELGVATGTYYGDGNYPVYAEMDGKRVKSIRIDFT